MEFYDELEIQPASEREATFMKEFSAELRRAAASSPFWAERLKDIDLDAELTREYLRLIPILRKSELPAIQEAQPPFGGLSTINAAAFPRLFLSPGPICEPARRKADAWNAARGLHAAGFRTGDILLNSFSYHLTPAGFLMDEGARSLGCAVIPAGGGNTEQIIKAIVRYRPQAYTGTADYLRILMDAADQAGVTFTITKAALSGAALPASLHAAFAQRGIECYELYGTAELGIIAYETSAHTGLVVNEGMMVEIVEPGSGKPVAEGDVGEVVVTTLDEDYPLFRFATGDLSAFAAGLSGCGRSNQRLRGWLGRADETTKVKGMFVHPAHVRQLIDEYRTIVQRARFVIDREDERDVLTLEVETTENGVEIEERLAASIRAATRLGSKVRLCQPGELGQDPRSIIDRRVVG